MTRQVVSITVNSSGDGTGYTSLPCVGFVQAIRYIPDGTSPYDTGVDFTITARASGLAILTVTNAGTSAATYYPRAATASVANAAALYAAAGTAVNDRIPVADEQIKIVVAQGGNATTGAFHVYVGD